MKKILILVCLASLASGLHAAELSVSERYSYAMGVRLGELLQSQGISDLDSDAFAAAIDDVLNNRPLRLSDQEMRDAVIAQREAFAAQREQRAQENLEAGRAFLARNASRPGVTVLPSGLQFEVLAQGNGVQPTEADTVRVHYHGSLIDGTVFDSSVDRGTPAEFPLAGVVPGFREAISNMRVGDKWRVYLPSELGYGERGAGADISPNSALVFEIELLDIVR
jgi:FKBP-type peptidyl-prolyl cis-trans isomerase FklB